MGAPGATTCLEVENLRKANGNSNEALSSRGMDGFCKTSSPHHKEGKNERTFGAMLRTLLQITLAMAARAADCGDRTELHAARASGSNRKSVLRGLEISE